MKSSKVFNNISEELKKQIPKLKSGETVVFRMLNGTPNPDPDEAERSKNPILYGKLQLNTNFRIFDSYKDEYVDVGCVDQWKGEEPLNFRFFVPGQGQYSRFQGKFSLTGGNARDEELYEILWLSPQRLGSPCSDTSTPPIFEILDIKSGSKALVTKFDKLKKALDLVADMKPEKAREIMAALNQPTYQDDEVLMAKIKELASTNPDTFIQTSDSKETPIKSIIKTAIDTGVITHDIMTGEIKMGNMVLSTLKITGVEDFVPEFSKWINTAANGQDVLNNIKSRLDKKAAKTT
jgi:hypothetical protein